MRTDWLFASRYRRAGTGALAVAGVLLSSSPGSAQTFAKVRLIISTQQGYELFAPEVAQVQGFFTEEGLEVSIIYGDGGAATIQAILTGSADVVIGTGTLGVITAFAKGGPITIVANGRRGTGDVFWYVPAASPLKTLRDLEGKTLVYSRPGSTTHLIAQFLLKDNKINAKLVSVGGMAAARTMVMSGQIETGWASTPSMLDVVRKGEIRILARGSEAAGLADYSIRVSAMNSSWLARNRETAVKFQRAFWKGMMLHYQGGEASDRRFAERWGLDIQDVRRNQEFTPLADVTYTPVGNLDGLIKLAQEFDMIKEPLTEAQKANLVDIVWTNPPVK